MSQVPREQCVKLVRAQPERGSGVTRTRGYEKAEVDASTLESRVAPGLWLCGEVLDVEGRLGGFSFSRSGRRSRRRSMRSPTWPRRTA